MSQRTSRIRTATQPAEQFREELSSIFQEVVGENCTTVEVNAGELHRRVGDYPGPKSPDAAVLLRYAGSI